MVQDMVQDNSEKLDMLLKAEMKLVEAKKNVIEAKASLREMFKSVLSRRVSGNTLQAIISVKINVIRKLAKRVRELRNEQNKIYFELGGKKGAKNLNELYIPEPIECDPEPSKSDLQVGSFPSVEVTGYITVPDVHKLMESMLKFLSERKTDDERFKLKITSSEGERLSVTHEA